MGPSANSHDFFMINCDWSLSLATSLWLCPATGLYPGGDGKSVLRFLEEI